MKRFLIWLLIFGVGLYCGFNLYKFNPLWQDKIITKNDLLIRAFDYKAYNDNSLHKKFYFQTAFKHYGRKVDDINDKKYLIYTLVFAEKKDYSGIGIYFPQVLEWTWQARYEKFFGISGKIYKTDMNSVNEYGDFIVFEPAEWQKELAIATKGDK